MAWIERKVTRTSQPQELTNVNWSNPITEDLAFVWNASEPSSEIITGTKPIVDNTTVSIGSIGKGVKSSLDQQNLEWNRQFITTSNQDGSGDFTMVVLADPTFSSSVQHIFFQKNDAGGAPFAQGGLAANADSLASGSSGSFSFFTYNASTSGITGVASSGAIDGNSHVWLGTRFGNVLGIYKDGLLLNSAVVGIAAITQSSPSRYTAIGSRGNGTSEGYDRNTYFAASWNRALSNEEIKSISANPWQILEDQTEYIWVDDFVSTGTTPVDSDRLVNYLINTSSTTDLSINYSVRTSAIQDAIFEYSINSSLSSDRSASYNIRTIASSDDLNQYLIRTFANSDITSSFNTRTSASNDEVVNYLIRANALADSGYSYLIRNATQVDFSTLYNIFGPLASDLIQSYNIRSSVNTSSTYNFNIQNSIQSDEVNQYNIRTTASNTTAADYNIRTNAGTNLESLYEIINAGQVSQALNIQYNIRALSDNSFNSYYLIYSAVGQNVDAAYNIRTGTFKDIQFSYDITAGISTIASDLTAMYNVLSTSSITQQDLINISTQVWNHSLTGDRTPSSAGSMLQDVSAREAAR